MKTIAFICCTLCVGINFDNPELFGGAATGESVHTITPIIPLR